MENEPRETFEEPAKLFALLGISTNSEPMPEQLSPPPRSTPSPKSTPPSSKSNDNYDMALSYEERAALRRAEREERRRQREALA